MLRPNMTTAEAGRREKCAFAARDHEALALMKRRENTLKMGS